MQPPIFHECEKSGLTKQIITDVPDEVAACQECNITQCVEGKFRKCPNRLARVAALKALRDQDEAAAGPKA
jgi:hypothetical protein